MSSETLFLEAAFQEGGIARTASLVARLPPLGEALFAEYDLERQWRVQDLLHGVGLPVAEQIGYEPTPAMWVRRSWSCGASRATCRLTSLPSSPRAGCTTPRLQSNAPSSTARWRRWSGCTRRRGRGRFAVPRASAGSRVERGDGLVARVSRLGLGWLTSIDDGRPVRLVRRQPPVDNGQRRPRLGRRPTGQPAVRGRRASGGHPRLGDGHPRTAPARRGVLPWRYAR